MSLAVIGAGFGRTGTASIKIALELLGLGPCHHMKEVSSPESVADWLAVAEGEKPEWDRIFSDYGSCIDWPAAFFWRELSEYYPDAKILLTVRDSESWYKSMENTIFRVLKSNPQDFTVADKLVGKRIFNQRFDDKEYVIGIYEQNIRDVQAVFSSDRLLTYELGAGWEPLCRFLGKPVPDVPFPQSNTTQDFQEFVRHKKEAMAAERNAAAQN